MKASGSKLIKWSIIGSLAVVLLLASMHLLHGTVLARGAHHAFQFGHESGRFIGGERFERITVVEHKRAVFPLLALLLKVGVLLLGAALFVKGKSIVKWGGGFFALLALWSLLSFWTIVIGAAIVAAYWLMRKKKGQEPQLTASAEWLGQAGPQAYNQAYILDQWEQQIRKEEK
ncbi:hypothetical protein FHS18_005958 [Paenibacillus phyllosphaerae]|uniref:Uncharacterized protein n=1 Tax=Paenibacillus phyllosphaerae TaxID=274593 RepID=A0A7W5FQU8_9BACL|nr:hypothetical protein [Paenibacillus phyllosphaerae]MBB3113845.1 hypothetical protein [Paenibacillus phyllosphaerae]